MGILSSAIPDYIQNLVPYVPGKPIEETQREYKLKRVIKLASNENPLGPSPKAIQALRKGVKDLHRYPDSSAHLLKSALSKKLNCENSNLILGNGSNEIIDLLIRSYCIPGDEIVTAQAAFLAYRICAQIHGVSTVEVPYQLDLRADLKEMAKKVREQEKVKIVFLANPNNPTGGYHSSEELSVFLEEVASIRKGSVLVVLDYAYWEYVQAADLPRPDLFLSRYSNLVILRTFSKIYGLAGLRVGYGIAEAEIISTLEKVRQPFNLNSLALLAATAALSDTSHVKKSIQVNKEGMKYWKAQLDALGIFYWPSQGNFLMINIAKKFEQLGISMSGLDFYQNCLKKGVIFRPVNNYGLKEALRISIGTSNENRMAIRILKNEMTTVHQKRRSS